MATMTKREVAVQWRNKIKSTCKCGHLGDGSNSQHDGILGHGSCKEPNCKCIKFSWAGFVPEFQEALEKAQQG